MPLSFAAGRTWIQIRMEEVKREWRECEKLAGYELSVRYHDYTSVGNECGVEISIDRILNSTRSIFLLRKMDDGTIVGMDDERKTMVKLGTLENLQKWFEKILYTNFEKLINDVKDDIIGRRD